MVAGRPLTAFFLCCAPSLLITGTCCHYTGIPYWACFGSPVFCPPLLTTLPQLCSHTTPPPEPLPSHLHAPPSQYFDTFNLFKARMGRNQSDYFNAVIMDSMFLADFFQV